MKITKLFIKSLIALLLVLSQAQAASKTVFYHHDALGSIVSSTDENGEVLWNEEYQPYGEKIDDIGNGDNVDNPDWYTGKNYDKELDISYFGARWYDAKQGRFLSIDPVGVDPENLHSFNRYAYANNNPYKYVDPDGREAVPIKLMGLTAKDPVLKLRTYYVDKKISSNVSSFVQDARNEYPSLSVNNTFRVKDSSTINTQNTKAKGLSRHQAGFAIDLNGTGGLSTSQLANLRKIANQHSLGPALIPNADKPHFSADPTKHGYDSLSDAVKTNRADYLKKTKEP